MSDEMTSQNQWGWLILLVSIIMIIFSFQIGYHLGFNAANPCIEYSTECEMICSGEGTPAYDCYEECPCLKRKYE